MICQPGRVFPVGFFMRRPVQWNYAALGYKSGTLYDRKKVGNKKSVCFNMFFDYSFAIIE